MAKKADPPIIRTSERKCFRNCQQQWWWGYREGLVTKGRPADALWMGTGIHLALAEWYLPGFERGPHPADTWEAYVGDELRKVKSAREDWQDEPLYEDALELGITMMEDYVEHYGEDEHLEILAVEQPFQIDIAENGEVIATYAGTFDGVARDHSERRKPIYLLEHKTASAIATNFLTLDDQAGGYFAVATKTLRSQGIIGERENIDGVLYNYIRKAKRDERDRNAGGAYLNKDGTVSKRQPAPQFVREVIERSPGEVARQFRRIVDEVRVMNGVRSGELPIIKNTNWKCPYCQFFEMCQLDEKGNTRGVSRYKSAAYSIRDPYLDHRKSTEE